MLAVATVGGRSSAKSWSAVAPLPSSAVTLFWLAVVGVSAVAQASPGLQTWLQYDRAAIGAGQVWRLLTGNLVHYNWCNWAANVVTFAALCWVGQGRARGLTWVVGAGALAVGASLYVGTPEVATYRGISGVDCALFGWVLVVMAFQDGGVRAAVYVGAILLWGVKAVYEAVAGCVLLPTSAPAGVEVIGLVHVVGLVLGAGAGVVQQGPGVSRAAA